VEGRLLAALVCLNAAALVVFVPAFTTIDYRGAGRTAAGVVVATLLCLPLWQRLGHIWAVRVVAVSWSLAWFFVVAMVVGRPGYSILTT
jgi:hypothetical protein